MVWLLVVVAGVCETAFALSLKASDGFTRPVPTALFLLFSVASFALLATALRTLPVGPAYAVWTGIGAAGTAVVGMVALGESTSALKIASIVLVVLGVVGLQLSTAQG